MRFAVVVFPGSNGDVDMFRAIKDGLNEEVEFVWHDTECLDEYDGILLPGGFSYGDYLRCGAIARFSKVMGAVKKAAEAGKPVLGVCNGFQILVEAGLLPGVLMRNQNVKFICKTVDIKVVNNQSIFTSAYAPHEVIRIPIAHGEGYYYCDEETYQALENNGQIAFTYMDNPNGSVGNIAGVMNARKNVLGMMPHPERATEALLGSDDGLKVFQSILMNWRNNNVVNT